MSLPSTLEARSSISVLILSRSCEVTSLSPCTPPDPIKRSMLPNQRSTVLHLSLKSAILLKEVNAAETTPKLPARFCPLTCCEMNRWTQYVLTSELCLSIKLDFHGCCGVYVFLKKRKEVETIWKISLKLLSWLNTVSKIITVRSSCIAFWVDTVFLKQRTRPPLQSSAYLWIRMWRVAALLKSFRSYCKTT